MARFRSVADKVRRSAPPVDPPAAPSADPKLLVGLSATPPADEGWTAVELLALGPAHAQDWAEVEIRAGSLAELRRALPWLVHAGRTPRLRVAVARTDRPRALRPPALVGNRPVASALLTRKPLQVEVELAKPAAVAALVRACLSPVEEIGRRHGAPGLRAAVADPAALSWTTGLPHVPLAREPDPADPLPPPDLVLRREQTGLPPVDTAFCSPAGFRPDAAGFAELVAAPDGLLLQGPAGTLGTLDPLVGLTENHIRSLREFAAVRVADASAPGLSRVLSQLSCAGVPVCAPHLTADLDEELGPDLAARLRDLTPSQLEDPLAREAWSVSTRRTALGRFSPDAYWRARQGDAGPTVSVVLATRRPDLLSFALAQVERQDWPRLEVVLVLHGAAADHPAVTAAAAALTRPLTVVEVPADVVFGRALQTGLARCSGRLVTKMDDDDWYGVHHVTDLVQAHAHSGATLVGSSGYHLYVADADATLRWTKNPTEAAATWVHGGTMLLARDDLTALGGWPAVPVGEDAHLIRAVRESGGWIYGIHDLGFLYYRGQGHTWMPATGSQFWLDAEVPRAAGFAPPPQLDALPHPWVARPG
ncbi:glycosyltransferase [Sporichthya polymorpha]|uniref:glycosyltransferase n=1 Tax=Sporichthya polymorpha TaxID=35751 RepID=UPI00037C0739|nr:glycosyltransferase [Sporichthya polymorpha]